MEGKFEGRVFALVLGINAPRRCVGSQNGRSANFPDLICFFHIKNLGSSALVEHLANGPIVPTCYGFCYDLPFPIFMSYERVAIREGLTWSSYS